MGILQFFRGEVERNPEDLETWSTPKLTEVMAVLIDQLKQPQITTRERIRFRAEIDRIVRQIEKRKLGT